jgi:hypothetical protein
LEHLNVMPLDRWEFGEEVRALEGDKDVAWGGVGDGVVGGGGSLGRRGVRRDDGRGDGHGDVEMVDVGMDG